MDFDALLAQVRDVLQRQGRLSYLALKLRFNLDDEALAALKDELIYAQHLALDEDERVLVWTGESGTTGEPARQPSVPAPPEAVRPERPTPAAERRQLTVVFCDLVGSTALAGQLDPEELREVVRAYQEACAKVIARSEGHIAQYLGDGLLVYFGYPLAHEDDAQRAVRAGLGIVEALGQLNTRLAPERGVKLSVRLGIHTGLVVVGEVGEGPRQEQLALGETPNIAARLQGIAAPDTLVISAATFQLLGGFFACQSLGTPSLKGLTQPLEVYQVLSESTARSRLEAAVSTGQTPLVGREQEVGLLLERWARVKDGLGQVVLLSGESGIGKSRLVQALMEHVATEPQAWLTPCQCSPYYQNTALYPLIDTLEQVALRFSREESSPQKLSRLEGFLVQYGLPLAEAVPLFAALLSLPLTGDYAPLTMSPEQQKQKTLHALLTIVLRIAAQQPVLFVMEDLHWVDPSTLEFLSLLVDQGPTARILALLTFRPDFSPPWAGRSHLTQVTLHRLTGRQAAEMAGRVARSKALPEEVVAQVVARTDGVPLFVEELTKMLLESGLLPEGEDRYELSGALLPLAIPTTLHDSLMARLDRLAVVKGLAQLGATLGREFSYALLQAVSPWDESTLQRGLHQLVEAEFLYQRGLPPQATYLFKHALIQEAAYQSLLRRTRQQYHHRIAQVLETQFAERAETQPELLAHHYTEAGLTEVAIDYWLRAGVRAKKRSANVEAIGHLTKGLALLETLPDTPDRTQQDLRLHIALGAPLIATKGYAAPDVERVYTRARQICQAMGETSQLFPVLSGLWMMYSVRGELQTARDLGEQLLALALRVQDPALCVEAYSALGISLFWLGEIVAAREHLEQGSALYDLEQHGSHAFLYGVDPGVGCLTYGAWSLWLLGYPDQALVRAGDAITLASRISHPFSMTRALNWAAMLHQFRRETEKVHARTQEAIALSREQGFPHWLAQAMILQGRVLADQGQEARGIAQMRQALAAYLATGAAVRRPYYLALLAEPYGRVGDTREGLAVLTEAVAAVHQRGEHWWESELHRLRGELGLRQGGRDVEVEACFHQALEVARHQQAKSLELRAAMGLGRLWQQQGKRKQAHELLAPVYGWFTEGFDTADLREAAALLEQLS